MPAMEELERQEAQPAKKLVCHGYEAEVTDEGRCDRCNRKLADAYLVSLGGEQATHRLCPGCHSWLQRGYGAKGEGKS